MIVPAAKSEGSVEDGSISTIIRIDCDLFPDEVVEKAAYWITGICDVHLSRPCPGEILAGLRLKTGGTVAEFEQSCLDFRQALLDFAVRARVAAETKDIHEALLRRAFIEMAPALGSRR